MNRLVRLLGITLMASTAMYSGACSDDAETTATSSTGGEENPDIADVIYGGEATDEALEALLQGTASSDPAKTATLTSPADAAELPSSPIPTFAWAEGTSKSGFFAPTKTSPSKESQHWLRELVGPERRAHAHGDPINGNAYLVVFSTAANDKLVRVFTTETTYKPDDATWKKMVDAKATIEVSITTGVFDNNLLAADGGPFVGTSTSFTIKP